MKRRVAAALAMAMVLLAITVLAGCGRSVSGVYAPTNEPGNTLVLL